MKLSPHRDLPQSILQSSNGRNLLLRRLMLGLCGFSVTLLLGYSIRYSSALTHGFAAYYGFSKLLVEGKDLTNAYDTEYFNAALSRYGFGQVRDIENNLPTNALIFVPLTPFSPPTAKIIWTIVSLILYALSVTMLLSVNKIKWNDNLGLAMISLACLWRPSYENIALGQFYIALLFLFCLSMHGLVRKNLLAPSLSIASTIVLKGYGIVNALWFIFNNRRKSALIVLLSVVGIFTVTLPLFGLNVWSVYYERVLMTFASSPKSGHIAYQTVNSLLLHLFSYDPIWLPSPIVELQPQHLRILILLTSTLIVVYVLYKSRHPSESLEPFGYSTALALTVITAPLAEEHHYVLFLPLVFGILKHYFPAQNGTLKLDFQNILCMIAIIVLAVPIRFKLMQSFTFPWYLFGYPKLFAGMILIASSVSILTQSRVARVYSRDE